MSEFLPGWVMPFSVWVGSGIGFIIWGRSSAKKRFDESLQAAKAELAAANKDLVETQAGELTRIRAEVHTLRSSVDALTALNQRLGAALSEKDIRITELERDVRIRDAAILKLESERHRR